MVRTRSKRNNKEVQDDNPAEPQVKEAAPQKSTPKKAKTGLALGDMIPDHEVVDEQGKDIKLQDLTKENGIVIFFYPKANTPGCTKQACGFRDDIKEFLSNGYKVYGMSADKPDAQKKWQSKHDMPYSLLCDPSFKVLQALGVAKGATGVKRSHLIFDKGGKLVSQEIQISPAQSVDNATKYVKEHAIEGVNLAADTESEDAPKKDGAEDKMEVDDKDDGADKPDDKEEAKEEQAEKPEEAGKDDEADKEKEEAPAAESAEPESKEQEPDKGDEEPAAEKAADEGKEEAAEAAAAPAEEKAELEAPKEGERVKTGDEQGKEGDEGKEAEQNEKPKEAEGAGDGDKAAAEEVDKKVDDTAAPNGKLKIDEKAVQKQEPAVVEGGGETNGEGEMQLNGPADQENEQKQKGQEQVQEILKKIDEGVQNDGPAKPAAAGNAVGAVMCEEEDGEEVVGPCQA